MSNVKSVTKTTVETLTTSEENIVRMVKGYDVPASIALETKAGDNEVLLQQLLDIEKRTLAAVGNQESSDKRKIISALRRKR